MRGFGGEEKYGDEEKLKNQIETEGGAVRGNGEIC